MLPCSSGLDILKPEYPLDKQVLTYNSMTKYHFILDQFQPTYTNTIKPRWKKIVAKVCSVVKVRGIYEDHAAPIFRQSNYWLATLLTNTDSPLASQESDLFLVY